MYENDEVNASKTQLAQKNVHVHITEHVHVHTFLTACYEALQCETMLFRFASRNKDTLIFMGIPGNARKNVL